MVFPWLQDLLARLTAPGTTQPHAVLLHGQSGIGVLDLARAVARDLLCEAEAAERRSGGCDACSGCLWFEQGTHPDFRFVTSDALAAEQGMAAADDGADDGEPAATKTKKAPSKEIRIEQGQQLHAFLSVATHRNGFRVVLIHPLEAVNDATANSLLKMLEEPPPRTVFLLVADHVGRIPATIVSRCRKVPVPTPPATVAVRWLAEQGVDRPDELLALAGGAPLAALALARDTDAMAMHRELLAFLVRPDPAAALATAEAFARVPPAVPVRWIQQWLADCIAARMAGRIRYHPARSEVIGALAGQASPTAMMALMEGLAAIRRAVDHPLNTRLMLEGLLLAYVDAIAPTGDGSVSKRRTT